MMTIALDHPTIQSADENNHTDDVSAALSTVINEKEEATLVNEHEKIAFETAPDEMNDVENNNHENRTKNDSISKERDNEVNGGKYSTCAFARDKKSAIGLMLFVFIILVIVDSTTTKYFGSAMGTFLEWVENNPVKGVFGVIFAYFVSTILFIPGSILTLGTGYIFANAFGLSWGVLIGSISVFVGAMTGESASFLLGRYLLRDWVEKNLAKKYAIFEALDAALRENGFQIMLLLRLSPIIPFNVINYAAGVTGMSFGQYILATLGILPGTVLYVFIGASASSLTDTTTAMDGESDEFPILQVILIAVGIIFAIVGVGVASYYAKNQLNRILTDREQQQDGQDNQDFAGLGEECNGRKNVEDRSTMTMLESECSDIILDDNIDIEEQS